VELPKLTLYDLLGLQSGDRRRGVVMQVKAAIRKRMPLLKCLTIIDDYAFDMHLQAWVERTSNSADHLSLDDDVDDVMEHHTTQMEQKHVAHHS
jgi:hypothetical protein